MSVVYILGIGTYGGFIPIDATLSEAEANNWLQMETEQDTMPAYKVVDWKKAPDAVQD